MFSHMSHVYTLIQNCRVSKKKMKDFNKVEMDKINPMMTIHAREVRERDYFFLILHSVAIRFRIHLENIMKHYIGKKGKLNLVGI